MLTLAPESAAVPTSNNLSISMDEPWKILIYDTYCQNLLSPVLKIGDLRRHGVTLHLLLHSDRQAVPDVPALYFCLPNKDNVKRIAQDCQNKLYDSIYLNFTSSINKELLSSLAQAALESDSVNLISKIYDQYLDFVCLESNFFSLNQQDSFTMWNNPAISDEDAEFHIQRTVEQLFSVCVNLQVVPIIRCTKNGAVQMIAEALDNKLNTHLANLGNLFNSDDSNLNPISFQRPVLILLDRNLDLPTMVSHTWSYQSLTHDILNLSLNKARLKENPHSENFTEYDFDSSVDPFLQENKGQPFHAIAQQVKSYLSEYKNSLEEFNKISGGNVDIDHLDEGALLGKTKNLGTFVTTIPALREKKRIIDLHTNVATSLLEEIKKREIDSFFDLEMEMLMKKTGLRDRFFSLMDSTKGTIEDRARLFLVYFLTTPDASPDDVDKAVRILRRSELNLADVIDFLKKKKAYQSITTPTAASASSTTFSKLLNSANVNVFDENLGFGTTLGNQLSELFSATVKKLSSPSQEQIVTSITRNLMESSSDPKNRSDEFLYFDPKVLKKNRQGGIPRYNTAFKDAIVFMVGGGNYVEYQSLQEFAQKNNKTIIYGATDTPNPCAFVQQLVDLSKKSK